MSAFPLNGRTAGEWGRGDAQLFQGKTRIDSLQWIARVSETMSPYHPTENELVTEVPG
jgi:hypothetical protein